MAQRSDKKRVKITSVHAFVLVLGHSWEYLVSMKIKHSTITMIATQTNEQHLHEKKHASQLPCLAMYLPVPVESYFQIMAHVWIASLKNCNTNTHSKHGFGIKNTILHWFQSQNVSSNTRSRWDRCVISLENVIFGKTTIFKHPHLAGLHFKHGRMPFKNYLFNEMRDCLFILRINNKQLCLDLKQL